MAQKQRPQAETLYGSPQPNYIGYATAPIISRRDPTSSDTGYPLGQVWVNKVDSSSWILTSVSAGVAVWQSSAGEGLYPVTPYVVGPEGEAGYQTIQSAIDAANAAGGGTVFIQPGTYTENLTLYSDVNLVGSSYSSVIITGIHTPPTSGDITFQNINFSSATHILSSTAAGSANISIVISDININGYIFNLPNWTGTLILDAIADLSSTSDGIVNNSGGSSIEIFDCTIGINTNNTMTTSGNISIQKCGINCPVSFATGSVISIISCIFTRSVTFANNSTGIITFSYFNTGASTALTMSSSAAITLSSVTVNSSANPCIAGAGAGTLTLADVSFLSNSSIAGTLTLSYGSYRTGSSSINGNLSLAQAATQLQIEGGAVTDFIGTGTLASGTVTIANTNIAATDRIFIQRIASNGSTTLGELSYSISAGASFTVTSLILGTPGSTQTGDTSTFSYIIVRQL